jgi:hypothetical protein
VGDPLLSSTGRPLCDECSDPIEAGDDRDRLGARIVHADCAAQARRPLRLVAS